MGPACLGACTPCPLASKAPQLLLPLTLQGWGSHSHPLDGAWDPCPTGLPSSVGWGAREYLQGLLPS